MGETMSRETALLVGIRDEFKKLRAQAESALHQVSDEAFFARLDPEANSLALLVKHTGGNLRSRWSDFLTTDGEKPDRDRDGEFEIRPGDSRDTLMALWREGWGYVLNTLDELRPEDLDKSVRIRGEALSVPRAVLRSLTHTAGHVGQIVLLAKHAAGDTWQTLSIARGASAAFTEALKRSVTEK
jgi:hypothetical protein